MTFYEGNEVIVFRMAAVGVNTAAAPTAPNANVNAQQGHNEPARVPEAAEQHLISMENVKMARDVTVRCKAISFRCIIQRFDPQQQHSYLQIFPGTGP